MMKIPYPKAKIGDIVVFRTKRHHKTDLPFHQAKITGAKIYTDPAHWLYQIENHQYSFILDDKIIANLTTNQIYRKYIKNNL